MNNNNEGIKLFKFISHVMIMTTLKLSKNSFISRQCDLNMIKVIFSVNLEQNKFQMSFYHSGILGYTLPVLIWKKANVNSWK